MTDGSWNTAADWPNCVESKNQTYVMFLLFEPGVNCPDPPPRPDGGIWEWSGNSNYESAVEYSCGPYAMFLDENGMLYEYAVSTCLWNKTWSINQLDSCQGVRKYYFQ